MPKKVRAEYLIKHLCSICALCIDELFENHVNESGIYPKTEEIPTQTANQSGDKQPVKAISMLHYKKKHRKSQQKENRRNDFMTVYELADLYMRGAENMQIWSAETQETVFEGSFREAKESKYADCDVSSFSIEDEIIVINIYQ